MRVPTQILLFGVVVVRGLDFSNRIPFPANLEIDLVFPQNDTYAVVSPFPIIFAFQNADAIFGFTSEFEWNLECHNGTLIGGNFLNTWDEGPAPANPYFYINQTTGIEPTDTIFWDPTKGAFPYWRGEHDTCTLQWSFHYIANCTRLPDDSLLIETGHFEKRTGTVNFTLMPESKLPTDALSSYTGCPIFGTSVLITSNETSCPHIGDNPAPKPCDLKISALASNFLPRVPTATTIFIPTSTTTSDEGTGTSTAASSSNTKGGSGSKPPNTAAKSSSGGGIFIVLSLILSFLGAVL